MNDAERTSIDAMHQENARVAETLEAERRERDEPTHCWHEIGQRGGNAGTWDAPVLLLQCCHCGDGKTQTGKLFTDPEHGPYQSKRYRFEDA